MNQWITPPSTSTLATGLVSDEFSDLPAEPKAIEHGSSHELLKQALDTIQQQSTVINKLLDQLSTKNK